MAQKPIHERIAEAHQEFVARLGAESAKREIARRVYDDAGRFRDVSRYMKPGGPVPRLPVAVQLAVALEQPPDSFIDDPLVALAGELNEVKRLAASLDRRLQEFEGKVDGIAVDLARGIGSLGTRLERLEHRLLAEDDQQEEVAP